RRSGAAVRIVRTAAPDRQREPDRGGQRAHGCARAAVRGGRPASDTLDRTHMHTYAAPLRDMHFVMSELAGFDQVRELPGFEDMSIELAHAVLDEAGRFASGVLAP